MNGHLTVISCGLGPDDLSQAYIDVVRQSEVLAGGKRLLKWFPEFSGDVIEIGAHAAETVLRIVEIAKEKNVVVLASGDALFFGVARLFLKHVSRDELTILPNVSAAQAALSRLQVSWQSTRFFSVHGRSAVLPWRDVLRSDSAVIYCDGVRTPASVATELIAHYPAVTERMASIAANLGAESETIECDTLGELCSSSVGGMSMLVLPPLASTAFSMIPPPSLGLSDDCYEHENALITHPEIRAVVLSKLCLRAGVMWDLGAGSGSVSVEACGLCENLSVYAVERKAQRCQQIRINVENAGCQDYTVINGEILDTIDSLPAPGAVFVGGGGSDIKAIAERAYDTLLPSGRLVVTAVLEETRAAMFAVLPQTPRAVFEIAVRSSAPLGSGSMMKPQTPITIFVFKKGKI